MWKKLFFFNIKHVLPANFISHAQLPTALVLKDCVRVFFATRNYNQHSSVFFVDLSIESENVASFHFYPEPILSPGEIGCFDEHGVFPASIIQNNNKYFLYYIGWSQGKEAPLFYASIGVAFSNDGEIFRKHSTAPILARSEVDPCLVTSPHVYRDNEIWRMTYVSGIKWTRKNDGTLQSHYHIKLAESSDGLLWNRNGQVAIDFQEGETNIARSSVIRTQDDLYKMWYSYVHSKIGRYRIGYAESQDALHWTRKDHLAGITLDDTHAREMICYPNVFEWKDGLYMLYNGDNFGKEGFGIAVWIDEHCHN